MPSSKQRVAIFDFDGTIADSAAIVQAIYREEALVRGWPELTDDAYAQLRKGTIRQALKWVGIKSWQMPGILRSGRKRFYAAKENIRLFPGVKPMLKRLHDEGWQIYILSSNSPVTIRAVLDRNNIEYVHVLNRPALFGKSKSIRALVKSKGYDRTGVWMIGDEVRDIESAHAAGVSSIAVIWGLQDESILKLTKPTAIAYTLKDIERTLKAT